MVWTLATETSSCLAMRASATPRRCSVRSLRARTSRSRGMSSFRVSSAVRISSSRRDRSSAARPAAAPYRPGSRSGVDHELGASSRFSCCSRRMCLRAASSAWNCAHRAAARPAQRRRGPLSGSTPSRRSGRRPSRRARARGRCMPAIRSRPRASHPRGGRGRPGGGASRSGCCGRSRSRLRQSRRRRAHPDSVWSAAPESIAAVRDGARAGALPATSRPQHAASGARHGSPERGPRRPPALLVAVCQRPAAADDSPRT